MFQLTFCCLGIVVRIEVVVATKAVQLLAIIGVGVENKAVATYEASVVAILFVSSVGIAVLAVDDTPHE